MRVVDITDPDDERVFLSRYMAMVALVLRSFHRAGYQVHLIVTGVSGGGIFAVYPHRRYQPAKVRVFMDFLSNWFRKRDQQS